MDIYKQLCVGDTITVRLETSEIFQGEIDSIGKDARYIKLKKVYDHVRKVDIRGKQYYYKNNIVSIDRLKTSKSDVSESEVSSPDEAQRSEYTRADGALLMTRISEYVFINQCDQVYHAAMKVLRSREFIGVYMAGTKFGRLRPPSLLCLATEDQIFIFDLISFGSLFREIKEILESKHPRKIVFDSRLLCDSLLHTYKCRMNGFTDLLVAHYQITMQKEPFTLQQCIAAYIAPNIVLPEEDHPNELKKRPIAPPSPHLHSAACSVGFLHKLYGIIVHDKLLKSLEASSIHFSEAFATNENMVDTFHDISANSQKGLDDVNVDLLSKLGEFSVHDLDETQTISSR